MGTDLVKINPSESWGVAKEVSAAAAASGLQGMKNQGDLALRIQYGMELGMGPAQALLAVQVVKDRPQLTTEALAAQVKRSGVYDYAVKRLDNTGCTLVFYKGNEARGEVTYTQDDAKQAGLLGNDNYKKNPRNMYFARALRNLVRWHCPDVVGGGAILDFDAVDDPPVQASVDADGVVTGEVVDEPTVDPADEVISQGQRRHMFAVAREYGGETVLRRIIQDLTGQGSTGALSVAHYEQVIERLEAMHIPDEEPEPVAVPSGSGDTDPDNHNPDREPDGQEDLFGEDDS